MMCHTGPIAAWRVSRHTRGQSCRRRIRSSPISPDVVKSYRREWPHVRKALLVHPVQREAEKKLNWLGSNRTKYARNGHGSDATNCAAETLTAWQTSDRPLTSQSVGPFPVNEIGCVLCMADHGVSPPSVMSGACSCLCSFAFAPFSPGGIRSNSACQRV